MDQKEALVIAFIFLLGLATRAYLAKYRYIFGFDSYYFARFTMYIAQKGYLPEYDPRDYYYYPPEYRRTGLLPISIYVPGYLALLLFGPTITKDQTLLIMKILPPLFGAITSVLVYLFLREFRSKEEARLGGILTAVVSGYVYRTMAGFYEDDAFGFVWMALGFYLLARSINMEGRKRYAYALASGFSFFLMAMTWELYYMAPLVLLGSIFLSGIFLLRDLNRISWERYMAPQVVSLAAFALFVYPFSGVSWMYILLNYVSLYLPVTPQNVEHLVNPATVIGKYATLVGEESPGRNYWWHKYNVLTPLPLLGALVLVWGMWKKKEYTNAMELSWVLVGAAMGFAKLKFTYAYGIPVALGSSVFLYFLLKEGRERSLEKYAGPFVLFILLGATASGFYFVEHIPGSNFMWENGPEDQAFKWVNGNTDVNAKFLNWWSDGHRLAFFTERLLWADNTNRRTKGPSGLDPNSTFARFLLSRSEEEGISVVRQFLADWGDANSLFPDYLYLDAVDVLGPGALQITAYGDVRYPYVARAINCYPATSVSGRRVLVCGGQVMTPQDFQSLPDTWTDTPNTYLGGRPFMAYRRGNQILLFSQEYNETLGVKLLMGAPLKHLTRVYDNGKIIIFSFS